MDEHGECEHTGGILAPEWCDMCINGITLPAKKKGNVKPKKQAKAQRPVMNADPEMVLLMEYLSGARCQVCDGLRSGPANHCWHVRAEIVQENISVIEDWAADHPDIKGKMTQTSAAGATSRVILRGGLRNAPSEIEGMSIGGLIGLASRAGYGRAMEWSNSRPKPGDELPV